MIETLELENYRGFKKHSIDFTQTNILVGKNNAGKSTIIEALRIISLVAQRYKSVNYQKPPEWLSLGIAYRGFSPSVAGFGINFKTISHRYYTSKPSAITAKFSSGWIVRIYLSDEGGIYAVIQDIDGKIIKTKAAAALVDIPMISILPQIYPVQLEEEVLDEDYVKRNLSSPLASLHFRNQIHHLYKYNFAVFKDIAEKTWPGLQIDGLKRGKDPQTLVTTLGLFIRDRDFVAEVAWMGHGLQMWLQMIWFIARTSKDSTIILDEPDVYMHADLQRKLVRFLLGLKKQIIIASHSIEIMAEVSPEDIIVVDKARLQSNAATTLSAVQNIISKNIGSIQNIQLSKLWSSRKLLIVEGKDVKYLKVFQNILYPDSQEPVDSVPNMAIGGWGGWRYVIGSSMLLKNSFEEEIVTYCLFDSDYHDNQDKEERAKEAKSYKIQLHIWSRKEIENYLLIPKVLLRVIKGKLPPKNKVRFEMTDLCDFLDKECDKLKEVVIDSFSQEILSKNKEKGVAYSNKLARGIVEGRWGKVETKLEIVPAKEILTALCKFAQGKLGISISTWAILKSITSDDIPDEVKLVLEKIEHGEPF